jgi:hypothetical protein
MTFTKKSSFKKPTNTLFFKTLQKPRFYGLFVTILLTNIGVSAVANRTYVKKSVRLSHSRNFAGFDSNSRSSIRVNVNLKLHPHVENLRADIQQRIIG